MKALLVGMDAADAGLVMRWADEGRLPTLAGLIERGSATRLSSFTGFGPEATWPTALTGCMPGKHGQYNWRVVKPDTNRRVYAPSKTYRRPFWSHLPEDGLRLLMADVRRASRLAHPNATEVVGWGERGGTNHESWPESLLGELTERFGSYPENLNHEHRGWTLAAAYRHRQLRRLSARRTDLLVSLIEAYEWDLCLATYYEPHYAGHEFHRYLTPGAFGYTRRGARLFGNALCDQYRAFDDGLARLTEAAGPACDVVVFSGFGMRPNTNGQRALDELMVRLGYRVPSRPSDGLRRRELARQMILRSVPRAIARRVRRRLLPEGAIRSHAERLWLEATDWDRTRAFAEVDPGHAYVRVAAAGASERDRLCAEITSELEALEDADTGAPAIARVMSRDEIAEGPHLDALPDLAIEWERERLLRRLRHPRAGVIEEDLRELQRSEHTDEGFLIAAGPRIKPGAAVQGAHVVDLAPTVLNLIGASIPTEMDGRPLRPLLADSVAAASYADIDWADDPWSSAAAHHGRELGAGRR